MRNISFALTTEYFRNKTKTVTRRLGWKFLKKGDLLQGCVKCMGLKPGEKIDRLGVIRVVSVRRERLTAVWKEKNATAKEGFPEMSPMEFAEMFMIHMKCSLDTDITRIEYEYI